MKKEGIFHTLCVFLRKYQKGFRHFNSLQTLWAAARDSFALATAPFCIFGEIMNLSKKNGRFDKADKTAGAVGFFKKRSAVRQFRFMLFCPYG